MPKLRVNFADARDFEALPAGTYDVVVEETEIIEGNKGPYVKWSLTVETGEHANRKLFMNTSTAAPGIIRMVLRAFGEDISDDVEEFDFDPDDYLGKHATARVTQRTYEQRLQNDVKELMRPGGTGAPTSNGRRAGAAAIR